MTETQKNPLAESFNAISLIRFAFPSMVMMLFMGLYTIVDTIFVARFVDTNALSSINIVCPVINLIVGLGTMLATGGSAVVAKKMGNGNTEEARSNFTLIVVTGAVIGLLITAAGLFFLDEIIWGLGASEILFPYCRDYLTIQLIFAACNMMQVLYQNLFVTAGKPALGLVLAVLAGIANIVFDYVFIVLLQMGIKGAAIGTGIGYMIPTIIGTIFFLRGSRFGAGERECGDRYAADRREGALPPGRRFGAGERECGDRHAADRREGALPPGRRFGVAERECGDRYAADRREGALPPGRRFGAGERECGDRHAADRREGALPPGRRFGVAERECGDRYAADRREGALPPERSELHFCKPDLDASVLLKSCSNGASELVSQCSTAVTTFLFNFQTQG